MARLAGGVMGRIADMSLPPEQRKRKQRKGKRAAGKGGGTAQMNHASTSKARKRSKEGEELMRRQREGPAGEAGGDADA